MDWIDKARPAVGENRRIILLFLQKVELLTNRERDAIVTYLEWVSKPIEFVLNDNPNQGEQT